VKSPTSEILKIEQKISTLPNGQKSVEGEAFILGLEPVEVDRVINFPVSSKHTFSRKSKYSLVFCGLVVHLL
jgi:hypothetical protein